MPHRVTGPTSAYPKHSGPPPEGNVLRVSVEAVVALLLAVLLFRTFAAEGFMISTGSMAPTLLGFHKRVACPKCHELFAFGTAWDESAKGLEASSSEFAVEHAICPNCSQAGIDLGSVPRNHGDQLLVNKQAYLWNKPHRWEIAVFRNPNLPTEAYVKRIVGLPGEAVSIYKGDIWINGKIERKPLSLQREMWIPVYHSQIMNPADLEAMPRWVPDDGPVPPTSTERGWRTTGTSFLFRDPQSHTTTSLPPQRTADELAVNSPELLASRSAAANPGETEQVAAEKSKNFQEIYWVTYHHLIRNGGTHTTSVFLQEWPKDLDKSTLPKAALKFDPTTHQFSCYGVLADDVTRMLKQGTTDALFRQAVDQLKQQSHRAPITDRYGYNPPEVAMEPITVRDVAFVANISLPEGPAHFYVQLTDGRDRMTLHFDSARQAVMLESEGDSTPLRIGPWEPPLPGEMHTIEASIIDRQISLAIQGKEVFPAWTLAPMPPDNEPPRSPVRFGVSEGTVRVNEPSLYRDVYYTHQRSRHGVNRPHELGPEEYFVLGDNSPISHDSRRWEHAAVHQNLLVGKPFLVHLPSQPGRLKVGKKEWLLRLPDITRIRFLK